MAKVDVTYKVVERGTTTAPRNDPVLIDKHGNEVNVSNPAVFNKSGVRKVDHFRIKFVIEDFGRSRLRFAPNASDVLWVQKGGGPGGCPLTPCHNLPYEIWVDKMHGEGKSIEVINMDLEPTQFWFTLNLVDKNNVGGPFVPVDPPGDNQNGGGLGSGFTFESNLLAGGMTGTIVGLGAASYAAGGFVAAPALAFAAAGAVVGLIVGLVLDRF